MEHKLKIAGINNEALKAYRPFDELTLKSLRDYYRIGLTYSSNALEGNSLTESETRVVIEDGLTIVRKPLRESGGVKQHSGGVNEKSNSIIGGEKQKQEYVCDMISQFPGINAPAIA